MNLLLRQLHLKLFLLLHHIRRGGQTIEQASDDVVRINDLFDNDNSKVFENVMRVNNILLIMIIF